jgi:hypothetical protein
MSYVAVESLYAIVFDVDPINLGTNMIKLIYSTDILHIA